MEITQTRNNQVVTTDLTKNIQDLNRSLSALMPDNSQTSRLITYTLLATAVVGVFVYHYIRSQED